MGAQYRKIVRSRKLAERSYLYFKYPAKDKSLEFYLPFMENIDVQEQQRANYATYDLIGRAGSLYAYLGAKSREMTLRFNITLPNIVDYIHNVGLSEMFADNFREVVMGINKSEERKKFFAGKTDYPRSTNFSNQGKFDYYTQGKRDIQQVDASFMDATDRKSGTRSAFEDIAKFFNTRWGLGNLFGEPEVKKGFSDVDTGEAVNFLMMWVNVIRTSVINNSTQTQYGPPIVYLNHGTMYNNIPCVCTNYSVKIQNNAGYELLSLAPRQVEIQMNLSETRTGNGQFGDFKPFKLIEGENLAGWEAVINDKGTMDPNNQFLRLYRQNSEELKAIEDLIEKNRLARSVEGPLGTGFVTDSVNPTPVSEGYGVLAPPPPTTNPVPRGGYMMPQGVFDNSVEGLASRNRDTQFDPYSGTDARP